MEEIWKPVPIDGLREKYEVSNFGRIRSISRRITARNRWGDAPRTFGQHIIKTRPDKGGYLCVDLRPYTQRVTKHLTVHRLVALAFIPNPNNYPCVDHIDTVRDNNRVDNLRWCTHRQNALNPITRQHLTQAMMGNQRSKGRKLPEWHRQKLIELNKSRTLSEESREKIRRALTGRKQTEERRVKTCKPIGQYALDGTLIKTWVSGTDAARELGLGWSNILRCANPKTKNKTAGGYVWKHL